MNDNLENINVSDEVIAICAINATLKTRGVVGMYGGLSNTISKNLLGKELLSKGVKVSQDNGQVEIDVNIIIEYGYNIPQVAWDIQENVKKEVNNITDINVVAVNIHVQGVSKNDQE
ncbi:MAG: Asp23/Gls24 family envelope stress response protein [Eubacteriales bacterium]|nr:Asp23/Gls24 family envelope stress response protein [Eubacteriales bacterium]